MKKIIKIIIIHLFTCYSFCFANDHLDKSFKPYYSSIKSNRVNARIGPNVRYPIKWIFIKKNEPVFVIDQFEQWRKVRDFEGDEGWIHVSMLNKRNYVVVIGEKIIKMYKNNNNKSEIIAFIEPNVRLNFINCKRNMCLLQKDNIIGWIDKAKLWGTP